MRIELLEGDGILHEDGIPRSVILLVTFRNQKVIKLPYSTEKNLKELYSDIQKMADKFYPDAPRWSEIELTEKEKEKIKKESQGINKKVKVTQPRAGTVPADSFNKESVTPNTDQHSVRSGDYLRCVKVLERAEGADVDIIVGCEYRILTVRKNTIATGDGKSRQIIEYYEVIDDSAEVKRRITAYPSEMVFSRKRSKPIEKTSNLEMIHNCKKCQDQMVLALNEKTDQYEGRCVSCGFVNIKSRPGKYKKKEVKKEKKNVPG